MSDHPSSAFSAPAALMACRIASRSCGVAPSELSALTTSTSLRAGRHLDQRAGLLRDGDVGLVARHRLAGGQALGWLTTGVLR